MKSRTSEVETLRETRDAKFHGLLRAKIAGASRKEPGDIGRVVRRRLLRRHDARLQRGLLSHNRCRNDFERDREDTRNRLL